LSKRSLIQSGDGHADEVQQRKSSAANAADHSAMRASRGQIAAKGWLRGGFHTPTVSGGDGLN